MMSDREGIPSPELLQSQYLAWMRMQNFSPRTVEAWEKNIGRFNQWCADRGVACVGEVTDELLAAYRRWLFHYRNPKTQRPLKFTTQASYLIAVRRWFRWLAQEKFLPAPVGEKLELPKEEHRLPLDVLTASEVESVLNETDVTTPLGLRDRAILETFYSTAIRCGELVDLEVYDLEPERRSLIVRRGKGRKDRVLPVGQRALSWLEKYLADVRPALVERSSSTKLFVSNHGRPLGRTNMSLLVRGYLDRAEIQKRGSCHLLRHTTATLMMENGADLRSLQELLGHARITTTEIYTHVSIKRLRDVHDRTHPASQPPADQPPPGEPPTNQPKNGQPPADHSTDASESS